MFLYFSCIHSTNMNTSRENLTETKYEERKPTNVSSLYFCIGFVIVFLSLVGYCLIYSNINRVTNGFDDCGYVCGQNNAKNAFTGCEHSYDKSSTPFLEISSGKCVTKCVDKEIGNRCLNDETTNDFKLFFFDLEESWKAITSVCITSVVFSYILFVLYRHTTTYIVWTFYSLSVFVLLGLSVACFVVGSEISNGSKSSQSIFYGVFFAIAAVVYVIYIIVQRKRVRLVIQLFKEASSALVNVPTLLIQPIYTFVVLIITTTLFVLCHIVIASSGTFERTTTERPEMEKIELVQDSAMMAAYCFNAIAFLWFTQFIIGCQHFIIAGAVSQWYFAKTKTKLDSPVKRTVSHLLRFHLGSICLGSILITIVSIVLTIFRFFASSLKSSRNVAAKVLGYIFGWIVSRIERFFEYLLRNAYIIVAKDGTPLITSGKRAIALFKNHFEDFVALNQVGNVVLFMGKLFIILVASIVGNALLPNQINDQDELAVTFVLIVIAFVVCHGFLTVFDMTLNTLFICFCDDCDQNDGKSRPYSMSENLLEVMKAVKKPEDIDFGDGEAAMEIKNGNEMQPVAI